MNALQSDALLCKHARISTGFIHMSRELASIACPTKGVWCDWINAFDNKSGNNSTTDKSNVTGEFINSFQAA